MRTLTQHNDLSYLTAYRVAAEIAYGDNYKIDAVGDAATKLVSQIPLPAGVAAEAL